MLDTIDFTLKDKAKQILDNPLLRKRAQRAYNHYVEVREEIKQLGYNPFKCDDKEVYRAFRIDSRRVEGDAGELGISDTPSGYWSLDAWMLNLQRLFFGRKVRIATEHPRTKRCISEFLLAEYEQDLTLEQYVAVWMNYAVTVQTTDEENQALARGAQKTQHFFDDWIYDTYPQHNIQLLYKPRVNTNELKAYWYEQLLKYCNEREISVELSQEVKDKIAKRDEKQRIRDQREQDRLAKREAKRLERERKKELVAKIKEEKRLAREAKRAIMKKGKQ